MSRVWRREEPESASPTLVDAMACRRLALLNHWRFSRIVGGISDALAAEPAVPAIKYALLASRKDAIDASGIADDAPRIVRIRVGLSHEGRQRHPQRQSGNYRLPHVRLLLLIFNREPHLPPLLAPKGWRDIPPYPQYPEPESGPRSNVANVLQSRHSDHGKNLPGHEKKRAGLRSGKRSREHRPDRSPGDRLRQYQYSSLRIGCPAWPAPAVLTLSDLIQVNAGGLRFE
jgi:hypothetical protein